jgi:flotillin
MKGVAEAEAMAKKADSWKEYNEAAIIQLVLQVLPEIAKAISEPLSKTESITVVNSSIDGSGASKVTQDITRVIAELPPVLQSLAGIDLKKLIASVPQLKADKAQETIEAKKSV